MQMCFQGQPEELLFADRILKLAGRWDKYIVKEEIVLKNSVNINICKYVVSNISIKVFCLYGQHGMVWHGPVQFVTAVLQ